MKTKNRLFLALSILLLSLSFMVSCEKNDEVNQEFDPDPAENPIILPTGTPIMLSYSENGDFLIGGSHFDNETKIINIIQSTNSYTIFIGGGDGKYSVKSNDTDVAKVQFDGGRSFYINGLSIGVTTVSIVDSQGISYNLNVAVHEDVPVKLYNSAIIYSDGITAERKAELESKVIADAKPARWEFVNKTNVDKVRFYYDPEDDTNYDEYDCVQKGKIPENQTSFAIPVQIITWFVMKSDTEEFAVRLTKPILLDNKKELIPGWCLVKNVTYKYIKDYPEVSSVYDVQHYAPRQEIQ